MYMVYAYTIIYIYIQSIHLLYRCFGGGSLIYQLNLNSVDSVVIGLGQQTGAVDALTC